MKLRSTIFWSALSTTLKLATGFVAIKFVSVLIGPSGVARIGQFQNFTNILTTIALAGTSSGLIKYTAEFKDNGSELIKIWSTSCKISATILLPMIIVLLICHKYLAIEILGSAKFGSIFIFLAIGLVAYVGNNLLLNILNGLHNIRKYTYLNILNAVVGISVTLFLVYNLHLYGAILALVINQASAFFFIIFFVRNENWFSIESFCGKIDKEYVKKLSKFTLMSMASMAVLPSGQMFVRAYLAHHTSWNVSGCWQGLQSLSNAYLKIVYLALGTYYLPKLSNLNDKNLIHKEIIQGYKLIMPFVIITSLFIYLSRDLIIKILFAKSFTAMNNMFAWQLIGDIFKIATWLLGYVIVAKSKTKLFVITEITSGICMVLFSIIFINIYGANGSVIGFALDYFLFFILFVYLYKKDFLI